MMLLIWIGFFFLGEVGRSMVGVELDHQSSEFDNLKLKKQDRIHEHD